MAINIKKSDVEFNMQLKNFAAKISKYGSVLGITPAEIETLMLDASSFDLVLNYQLSVQTFAQNCTSYKNLLRKGGDAVLGVMPSAPAIAPIPTAPAPNLEGRLRSLIQRISKHPSYTTAIGEDLGIEGAVTVFAIKDGKPKFHIELAGGYPNLRWTKGKFEGVEIWKDSGRGFVKLERDMKPDYLDKSPLPVAGTSEVWRYKMIYLLTDEPVGEWSDIMTVKVTGGD